MALLDFTLRPLGAKTSWMLAALSVLLGIYGIWITLRSQEKRSLLFYVNPAIAQLVQAGQSSKLAVSYDGVPVKSDVIALQVVAWNSGNLSIKKDNVLKPVVLSTVSKVPILEAKIRNSSRDVVNASLDAHELSAGRVGLNWSILEENDGTSIQLILAGDIHTKLSLEGVIEGQKPLKWEPLTTKPALYTKIMLWFNVLVLIAMIFRIKPTWKTPLPTKVFILLATAAMLLLIYITYRGSYPPNDLLTANSAAVSTK